MSIASQSGLEKKIFLDPTKQSTLPKKQNTKSEKASVEYQRYEIETAKTPQIFPYPNRFRVKVKKHRLLLLILKEIFHYRGKMKVVKDPPCVYGVFSGPVGGMIPREHLCVGCLRCTTQHPDLARIEFNADFLKLGDSYFSNELIDTIMNEAKDGNVPVKGAGYRGRFGGTGWNGMWTDMSEIVRPTRDGIHGREFISTVVDIGEKASFLDFSGKTEFPSFPKINLPLPMILDLLPEDVYRSDILQILSNSAKKVESLVVLPFSLIKKESLTGSHIVPLVKKGEEDEFSQYYSEREISMVEVEDAESWQKITNNFPQLIIALRVGFTEDLSNHLKAGIRVFHLTANYHGQAGNEFVLDAIGHAHRQVVKHRLREQTTLIGSGGIIAAEHVPKAIICGLDLVALDTPILVALQASLGGESVSSDSHHIKLPPKLESKWGTQRIENLLSSWRDQLLEILGAMGIREVRRLRGETGRAMFQKDLEKEAFGEITGYHE